MLVLTRKLNESILIGDDIKIKVVRVKGMEVRIGIEAPAGVKIDREEIRGLHDELEKRYGKPPEPIAKPQG